MTTHIWVEIGMGLLSLSAFAVLMAYSWKQKNQLQTTQQDLTETQIELDSLAQQSERLQSKFSSLIQNQFNTWRLTESEKEVALLLLKGLSLEEIAQIRETKQKTVRQQASNLYKKAGLSGRHELTAFFFEDLLTP
ncbi:hypothetical protein H8792_004565 [Thiomicrorhabdus sp. HH1]|uniref:HTH luxR-type domain-containing protein n=2 Tax=Piscirickettsiaceae TaxID=135616 RepID=A0ABS0BUV4_9GAMM|nr:hypothetical protein [Thiomicrorhabdus heinhorstiae]